MTDSDAETTIRRLRQCPGSFPAIEAAVALVARQSREIETLRAALKRISETPKYRVQIALGTYDELVGAEVCDLARAALLSSSPPSPTERDRALEEAAQWHDRTAELYGLMYQTHQTGAGRGEP